MSGWDEGATTYTYQGFRADEEDYEGAEMSAQAVKNNLLAFIREFNDGGKFIYRDQLARKLYRKDNMMEIDLADLAGFNEVLAHRLREKPTETMPLFESAARDHAVKADLIAPNELENGQKIQVTLKSSENSTSIRNLGSETVGKLVKLQGMITAATKVKAKAVSLTLQCKNCSGTKKVALRPGFTGTTIPRVCDRNATRQDQEAACPVDPYEILTDLSEYVDQQSLKLQEEPEAIPAGEMPRTMLVTVDRSLAGSFTPGTRVRLLGIYQTMQLGKRSGGGSTRQPYVRALGMEQVAEGSGRASIEFTARKRPSSSNSPEETTCTRGWSARSPPRSTGTRTSRSH